MAAHSSVLAWRIPGKAEPGGLPSIGSHRDGHDCVPAGNIALTVAVPMLPLTPAFLSACQIFCFAFFFSHYGQRGVSKSLWQENLSPALRHNRKSIFTQQQECHATCNLIKHLPVKCLK